jgi:hypothetical protein
VRECHEHDGCRWFGYSTGAWCVVGKQLCEGERESVQLGHGLGAVCVAAD